MKRCPLFIAVFMLLSLSFLMELMSQAPYTIQLKSRQFLPPVDQQTVFEAIRQQGISPEATLSGRYHVLLQFYELPDELQKNRLKAAGIVLHEYIPHRAFSASIVPTLTPNALVNLGVRFVGLFKPTDKLSPELLESYPRTRSKSPDRLAVYVLTYPDIPIYEAVSILIRKFDCEILSSSEQFHLISLILPKNQLNELASLEWVSWIEAMLAFKDRNDGSRALINVDSVQAAPYFLSGDGLNLGMWDGGRVYSHDGFAGRLVIKNNVSVSNHATHVAGTMAGNGANSNNRYLRGMDTLAYIYSWTYQGKTWDQIATEMKNAVTQDNIVLSQNSWGDIGGGGLYTVGAKLMDQVVSEKDISVIFAVGYGGHIYNSMWSPETGKNLIAVTATTKTGGEFFDASSGPCEDGRLKPDISAAGVDIQSTWPDNGYDYLTGTSMAAPAISGVIGLMIERYKNRNNGQLPSASLLKAILLNTATDIGTEGPDYFYGYGVANALEAIRTIDARNFLTDEISQGATQNYSLTVPAGINQIRVLLAYTDREASVNANPALVNDLDLKLISPNNAEYLPLTLDPANPSAAAQPAVNHRDNVEQVVVNSPLAGNWTVQISAPSVPFGPQEFTVTWKLPTIRVRVDQKLAGGQTSVDSIGRWEG